MELTEISIALCTFNGSKYLKCQLDSIANQTIRPNEIVVCDDCSSDETLKVLQNFKSSCVIPLKIIRNERQLGVSKNFEKAIRHCKGDIIFLCDQDDYWASNKIETMIGIMAENTEIGLLFSNANVVDSDLNDLGYTVWQTFDFDANRFSLLSRSDAMRCLVKNYYITGCTLAFRSEFSKKILPIPKECMHDAWLAFIIGCYADVKPVNLCLVEYRQHSNNVAGGKSLSLFERFKISKNTTSQSFESELNVFDNLLKKYSESNDSCVAIDCRKVISQKIRHLRSRKKMYSVNFFRKIILIIIEIITFRYFVFSRGIYSAAADALRITAK